MSSPDLFPPRDLRTQRRRRNLRRLGIGLVLLLVIVLVPVLWLVTQLLGSRPQLDGDVRVPGLRQPVAISRDALGVPTILSDDRLDAAMALGFLHGQDRFFQMDLLRRQSAGELSALVGATLLPHDRSVRLHRFRARAGIMLAQCQHRDIAEAYAAGVNAGLQSLRSRPFEYHLLRAEPQPWQAEDIFLVVLAMYLELQGSRAAMEMSLGVLYDTLPEAVAHFLSAPGSEWDAPLRGAALALPSIPNAETFATMPSSSSPPPQPAPRLPHEESRVAPTREMLRTLDATTESNAGSNAWAISGARSVDGNSMLAGDMHLGLAVPNIWYRASISFRDSTSARGRRQLSGFTLPGTPLLIVGSNGDVAWSFTAANVDQNDIVVLDRTDTGHYATPQGPRALQEIREVIAVAGGDADTLVVRESIWGPVVRTDARGRLLVHRWVAHDSTAVDFGLLALELARDVGEGVLAVTRSAIPGLNCILADRQGNIGWSVAGLLPRRRGFEGRLPSSWADGKRGWDGFVAPGDVPRVVNPESGVVWSANARQISDEGLARLGEGGYVLGARAMQIRDALLELHNAKPGDLLALQLDHRAVLLQRWQQLLLGALDSDAARGDAELAEMRPFVANWGGHASTASVGYRIVRNYRYEVSDQLLGALLAACEVADPRFDIWHLRERERPVWHILGERPQHLLPAGFETWDAFLVHCARATRAELVALGPLAERTWGERNTTHIQHPLSRAVPALGRWLDMPRVPLPGDGHVPRMQSPDWGASQRLVALPGREEMSLAHMPAGQSGHPLSPYYRNSHAAWEQGLATPLLPGPVEHTLRLLPAAD